MKENKEKAIKFINAILNKRFPNFAIEVADIKESCVVASAMVLMDEIERKKSLAVIFEVCDDIRSVPFYGRILIPKEISVIDLNCVYTFREETETTDDELECILNDPIFAD